MKLTYFDIRGLAEVPRLCLAAAGINFVDDRIPFVRNEDGTFSRGDWEQRKEKTPYGQVPVLEVNGVQIAQSAAIVRFIGRKGGLLGSNEIEEALIDAGWETVQDIRAGFRALRSDPSKAEAYYTKDMPAGFAGLEKNAASNKHFIGNKISIADIAIYYFLFVLSTENADAVSKVRAANPKINGIYETVEKDGKVAAYLAQRKQTNM
jgi:glutathione S-transferase